jgi:uncharacterized membrane-anchored protein YhcB (DUF1043 family)
VGIVIGIFIGWAISEVTLRFGKNAPERTSQESQLKEKNAEISDLETELDRQRKEMREMRNDMRELKKSTTKKSPKEKESI